MNRAPIVLLGFLFCSVAGTAQQRPAADATLDLDLPAGSWWLANQTLAKSLEFAGYDYWYAWGNGFHNYQHGRAIFPDTLRWLWRDYPRDSRPE